MRRGDNTDRGRYFGHFLGAVPALLVIAFLLAACSSASTHLSDGDRVNVPPAPIDRNQWMAFAKVGKRSNDPRVHVEDFQYDGYAGKGDIAPVDFPVHGIDVARYQGTVDWDRARRNGVSFAYIKATEGGDHHDKAFLINWIAARNAGIPRGGYHFYYFCRSAREQFAWFSRHVPVDRDALPPVLDMEWNSQSATCKKRPSREKVLKEMRIFLNLAEQHYGRRPIIYTSVDFHRDVLVGAFNDYPFWLRSVAGYPTTKYEKRKWLLWQYTATGRVPGIDSKVDRNVFAGSQADWSQWLAGQSAHQTLSRL